MPDDTYQTVHMITSTQANIEIELGNVVREHNAKVPTTPKKRNISDLVLRNTWKSLFLTYFGTLSFSMADHTIFLYCVQSKRFLNDRIIILCCEIPLIIFFGDV